MEDEVEGLIFPASYSNTDSRFPSFSSSSSRGSNNIEMISTHKNTPMAFEDFQRHGEKPLINIKQNDDDDDDDGYYSYDQSVEWWRYLSFSCSSSSSAWILLQVSWRFLVSLGIALLVFYMMTKPTTPHMSIEVDEVIQYEVGEGVDSTGVPTQILNCNISIRLYIQNPSNVFPLHIQPTLLKLSFGQISLASSRAEQVTVEAQKVVELHVGTKDKIMYGGGRAMEDVLESRQGLTLSVRITLRSTYHMVGRLVVQKFHHQGLCLVRLFRSTNRSQHNKQTALVHNTTCWVNPRER